MYKKLKGARVSKGYTQQKMGELLGITCCSYCYKENGKRDFTMVEIKKVLELLECKYEDIFL